MNIIHLSLNEAYTDNWGYQYNLLPRYHKKQGHDVTVITKNEKLLYNDEIVKTAVGRYILDDGVMVIRIARKESIVKKFSNVFTPYDFYDILFELKPDIIMIHGFIGSISALTVKKYLRNVIKNCRVVVDIHQDKINTILPKGIKGPILKEIHRYLNAKMYPYYDKIFYIAPSSGKCAIEYYKAPIEKMTLLPLGCDTNILDRENKPEIVARLRERYHIADNEIVICHGGKLNSAKKTVELIEAVKRLRQDGYLLKLLIFGAINDLYRPALELEVEENSEFVSYLGMLSQEEYYQVYQASDIAVFPGGQSVLWQQAIACGLAVAVRRHETIEYLDLGGNLEIVEEGTAESIYTTVLRMLENETYKNMKKVAEEQGYNFFSYEKIAEKVLKQEAGEYIKDIYDIASEKIIKNILREKKQ